MPFSMAEVCWAALVLFCVCYAARTVYRAVKVKQGRGLYLWRRLAGAAAIALAVYLGYTFLWGLNYYAPTFEQQSGIYAQAITVEEPVSYTHLWLVCGVGAVFKLRRHGQKWRKRAMPTCFPMY